MVSERKAVERMVDGSMEQVEAFRDKIIAQENKTPFGQHDMSDEDLLFYFPRWMQEDPHLLENLADERVYLPDGKKGISLVQHYMRLRAKVDESSQSIR